MADFFNRVAGHVEKLDVEGLRRQYKSLVNELGFFESILSSMKEGVLVIDSDNTLRYANASAERLVGFSAEKAKGRQIDKVIVGWDWEGLLEQPESGDGWARSAERELELNYPEHRILSINSMPSANNVIVLIRDITAERARADEALADGREDAVRDLAAGVAHEIGNPLNALSLNLQLLEREFRREPDPDRRERLQRDIAVCQGEVKRLDGIIREFLSALRPAKLNLEPGSLADPLKDMLSAMKAQFENRRITVTLDLPTALPSVMIDRAQMEQVFFNLTKNALEAMKDGGALAIEIREDDRRVEVSFLDNGGGMSAETLARIFEPYHTTKEKGTGLGLMICRRIVRAHGGEIDAESKPGVGTRFTVSLPRVSERIRRLS